MKKILSLIIVLLIGTVALYHFRYFRREPPVEVIGLTTGVAREVMKLVSLEIPATVFYSHGAQVPPNDLIDVVVDKLSGEQVKQIVMVVRGDIQYGIDFEAGISLVLDEDQRQAVWRLPPPKFLQIAAKESSVIFQWGPVTAGDKNRGENKATLKMREEASSPRYLNAAKRICEGQLSLLSSMHGYNARVVWLGQGGLSQGQ